MGHVHSCETLATLDGPGMRFALFLQGCLMRCQYCHNRDSWALNEGAVVSVADQAAQILRYHRYYKDGGGVTVSGGEPMLQPEFVAELFTLLKQNDKPLHCTIDTNGYIKKFTPAVERAVELADLVMLDLKQLDDPAHIALTHVSNRRTLQFAEYLAELKKPVWLRRVIVPGRTDDLDELARFGEFAAQLGNVERIELLGYHELGKHKWKEYNEVYPLEGVQTPSKDSLQNIKAILEQYVPIVDCR